MHNHLIVPDWDMPVGVKALLTTRQGGYSQPPFDGFNLAQHVNDNKYNVTKNRAMLSLSLPNEPLWLNQIHSNSVIDAARSPSGIDADASYTTQSECVCVVMTADCLPLLICNRQATIVAAVHAGWRGLLNGIVQQTVKKILQLAQCQAEDLSIYLGPAIGAEKFEVGDEVRQAFLHKSPYQKEISDCFSPFDLNAESHYLADIYQLARLQLLPLGIEKIAGGHYCTYTEKNTFFSYRREGKTGRMASLIWLEET